MSAMVASGRHLNRCATKSKMAMGGPALDLPFARDTRKTDAVGMVVRLLAPAPAGEALPSVSETVEVAGGLELDCATSGAPSQDQSLQSQNAVERGCSRKARCGARAKPPVVPSTPRLPPVSTLRWTISSTGRLQRSLDGNTWQEVKVAARTEPGRELHDRGECGPGPSGQERQRSWTQKEDKNARDRPLSSRCFARRCRGASKSGPAVLAACYITPQMAVNSGRAFSLRPMALRSRATSPALQFSDPHHGTVGTSKF